MTTKLKREAPRLKPDLEGVPEIYGKPDNVCVAIFLASNLCTEELDYGLAYQVLRYALVREVEYFAMSCGDRIEGLFARPEMEYVTGCDQHARHLLNAVVKLEFEYAKQPTRRIQELQRLGLMYGRFGNRVMATFSPSDNSRRRDEYVQMLHEAAKDFGFRLTAKDLHEAFSPLW